MAYAALGVAFIGLMLMLGGAMYESDYRAFDCENEESWDKVESCEKDREEMYDKSVVYQDAGYPILLFSIPLMIGANKLQDK